jgi:hypothetical protein
MCRHSLYGNREVSWQSDIQPPIVLAPEPGPA